MHRPATLFACRAWVPATRKRSLGLPVEHILLQSRLRLKINPLATSKLGHIYKKPGFSTLTAGFLPALVAGEWSWTKAEKGGFLAGFHWQLTITIPPSPHPTVETRCRIPTF